MSSILLHQLNILRINKFPAVNIVPIWYQMLVLNSEQTLWSLYLNIEGPDWSLLTLWSGHVGHWYFSNPLLSINRHVTMMAKGLPDSAYLRDLIVLYRLGKHPSPLHDMRLLVLSDVIPALRFFSLQESSKAHGQGVLTLILTSTYTYKGKHLLCTWKS